jgi:anaerobic ribonucleoside-triphosphate reductase activating protein
MCEGCHSPWLREDIGEELTPEVLDRLISENRGVNCICFMGEGKDPDALKRLAFGIKLRSDYPYKVALYSGRDEVEKDYDIYFDFIKIGAYRKEFGPLNKETTNQRLYEIERKFGTDFEVEETIRHDITYKFWKKD